MKRSSFLLSLSVAAALPMPLSAADAPASASAARGLTSAQLSLIRRSNSIYSLHEAAMVGDVSTLSERLREGENPNQADEFGDTPLHLAARGRSVEVLKLLLEAGADVSARDARKRSPRELCQHEAMLRLFAEAEQRRQREEELDALVRRGDESGVRAALAAGVNPNARTVGNEGFLLFAAVESGHAGVLRALLEAGADVNVVSPEGRRSALHIAAQRGNVEAIRCLLAAKADPMLRTANHATPLHEAVWNRRLEAVKALLPAYAAVNFSPDGAHNNFPVNMAMYRGGVPYVQAFLEAGLDPNAPSLRLDPPLIRAVRDEREDIVRLLLAAGADQTICNADGKTAADYASPALLPLLK